MADDDQDVEENHVFEDGTGDDDEGDNKELDDARDACDDFVMLALTQRSGLRGRQRRLSPKLVALAARAREERDGGKS